MSMIEYPYNTCHMAKDMLLLPYGNEREMNDGARTSSTSQRERLELVEAQKTRAAILLRSEVEARRNLHHVTFEVARTHTRGGSKENQQSLLNLAISPVAPSVLPVEFQPASNTPLCDATFCHCITHR